MFGHFHQGRYEPGTSIFVSPAGGYGTIEIGTRVIYSCLMSCRRKQAEVTTCGGICGGQG